MKHSDIVTVGDLQKEIDCVKDVRKEINNLLDKPMAIDEGKKKPDHPVGPFLRLPGRGERRW